MELFPNMIVYRITREKYHKDITGTGARIHGGRWNYKGIPILYASETRALSTLEYLVHTYYDLLPPKLKLLSIEIPTESNELIIISPKELPKNWQRTPPPEILKKIGQKYLIEQNNLAIKVPSVIVPDEFNLAINPNHQEFRKVKIKKIEPYKLDLRLLK